MQPETQRTSTLTPEQREERRRKRHESRAGSTYREFLSLASVDLGLPPEECEPIIAAVLTTLEQRLPFDEMEDLASQLPYKLRELLSTCEPRERMNPRDIGEAEFLGMVAGELGVSPEQAETYVRGVFRLLTQTVTRGEIEEVIHLLPKRLRNLWPPLP